MRVDSILLSFRLTPAKEQERQCCLLEGPAGRHSSAIGAPILPIQASSCGAGDPSLEVHKLLRLTCKTAPNQQAEASHLVTVGTTLMEMQFMSRTLIRTAALNKSYYTHSRPLRSWFVQARLLFKHVWRRHCSHICIWNFSVFFRNETLAEIVSWNQAYVTKLVSWDVRFHAGLILWLRHALWKSMGNPSAPI